MFLEANDWLVLLVENITLPETNSSPPLKMRVNPWKFGDSELGVPIIFRDENVSFSSTLLRAY